MDQPMPVALPMAYAAAAVLIVIHMIAGKLRFLEVTPRSVWLSIAGGVSVAYVFIHLLPELSEAQVSLKEALPAARFADHHVYLVALTGLMVFYGLEKLAVNARSAQVGRGKEDKLPRGLFWLHVGSFGLYNALVGYLLLHRERPGIASLAWFAVAMALHFLVADFGLREHYKDLYHKFGRHILSLAVVLGLILGQVMTIGKPMIAVLFGFLAGGVILNVLKEEVPKERKSRFWAFAAGAGGYSLLLLLL